MIRGHNAIICIKPQLCNFASLTDRIKSGQILPNQNLILLPLIDNLFGFDLCFPSLVSRFLDITEDQVS